MAKTTIVQMTDDLDGSSADRTVAFSFGGKAYEIDLSKRNAAAFEKALKPYIAAARPAKLAARRGRATGARRQDLSDVRTWAAKNGYTIAERGRVPGEVLSAYEAAH